MSTNKIHGKDRDKFLDKNGPNESSAADIRDAVDKKHAQNADEYLNTQVTKTLYVDGNRTDSYTENGSITKPFKTIQSAISAASAGDTIKVTDGTYILPGQIQVTKNISIIGNNDEPEKVVIQRSPDGNWLMFELKSDCYISGFKIIGGKSGFWSDQNIGCTIKNCIVENSIESAVYLYDGDGYVLNNITIVNPGQGASLSYSNGIYSRVDNLIIKNCTITSDKVKYMKWGIDIEAGNTVNILSNSVSGSWQAAIRVGAGAKPIIIKGNDIDDATEGYASECAINLAGNNDNSEISENHIDNVKASSAIGVYTAWGVKVKDNYIGVDDSANDIKSEGIRADGCGGSGSNRLEITGNKIEQTRYSAIILINSSNSYIDSNVISKCNYYGADGSGDWDYASIHGENDSIALIITNNKINDGISGIQVWGNNCVIKFNEIYDMGLTYADTKVTADGTYYNSGIIVGTNWLTANNKPTGTIVKENSVYDNVYGIFVRDYATLSPLDPAVLNLASLNCWFGDASGADDDDGVINGSGDKIAKTVTAEPFDNKGNRATDVRNDSSVSGVTVKDALETLDAKPSGNNAITFNTPAITIANGEYIQIYRFTTNLNAKIKVFSAGLSALGGGQLANSYIQIYNETDIQVEYQTNDRFVSGNPITTLNLSQKDISIRATNGTGVAVDLHAFVVINQE